MVITQRSDLSHVSSCLNANNNKIYLFNVNKLFKNSFFVVPEDLR